MSASEPIHPIYVRTSGGWQQLAFMGPEGDTGPVGPTGPPGPVGPEGQWVDLTQAEFDALDPPDPDTLYVIIG